MPLGDIGRELSPFPYLLILGQDDNERLLGAALLDSFEGERVPVAQRLLDTTDRAFTLVASDRGPAGRLRKLAFRTISQTGIHHRGSALSQTQPGLAAGAPRSGDRFPWLRLRRLPDGPIEDLYAALDDLHFHLLLFGQAAPPPGEAAARAGLRVHAIPDHPDNVRELERAHRLGGFVVY